METRASEKERRDRERERVVESDYNRDWKRKNKHKGLEKGKKQQTERVRRRTSGKWKREGRDAWHHVVYWSSRSIHESHSGCQPSYLPQAPTPFPHPPHPLSSRPPFSSPSPIPLLSSFPSSLALATNQPSPPCRFAPLAWPPAPGETPVRHPSSCIQRVNY